MRAELFSLRRTKAEVDQLNRFSSAIYDALENKAQINTISKTTVDRNPKRITEVVTMSLDSGNLTEAYIFANAVDTYDSRSFIDCFCRLAKLIEDAINCKKKIKKDGKLFEEHLNVYAFDCKGTDIKGYCFTALNKRFIALPAFELATDISIENFIAEGVISANAVIDQKIKDYPDGKILVNKSETAYFKSNGGFKSFILSFIPHKGDKAGDIIRKIIVLIAIGVFIAGGIILLKFYVIDPMHNSQTMNEIQCIFNSTPDEVIYATNDEGEVIVIDSSDKNWAGVKKVNKEIVAWIKIDGTDIDYPVLEHKGDTPESQYYLYRNYKKEYSDFGSIFVDYRCENSVNSKNLILHGHNMGSDDSMFGQLMNYARKDGRTQGNPEFYKDAPIITIDTPEGTDEYIIFAVMKIDVSNDRDNVFDYLKAEFDSDARFMNFIYNIKVRSYLNVDVPINEDDNLLTLSTCSYESDNMRTIVVARQVREGEKVSKYIKSVESSSPVSKANSSFSEELKADNISWYDGKGDLEGDETVLYMEQSEMYTVKFLNAEGKTISTQIILKGRDAKPPKENPRKAADGKYYYVFKGWDTVYTDVTEDLTIKPVFTKKKMPTVTEATTEETTKATIKATEAPYVEPETQAPQTNAPAEPTEAPTTKPAEVTEPPTTSPPATTAQPATLIEATPEATTQTVTETSE